MKRLIVALLVVLVSNISLAQSAEKTIDNFIDFISKNKITEIHFTCEIINDEAASINNMNGILFIDTANFYLQIENLIMIDNGKETINFYSDINEVTIFNNEEDDEDIVNPFSLIFNYKDHFDISISSTFQSMVTIDFKPKKDDLLINLQITLNNKTNHVSSLSVIDSNNTEYEYIITKFIPNTNKDKTIFEFKEENFPEATIIDMR
ncbi:MAG: outer membrane lipoprotein carrier protein LolA [Bacteroidales bacterium]|jgi:hypothetical protein|nr:outer membrane lipoprotein carrier protein LolA [Bacteroidales bacterium]